MTNAEIILNAAVDAGLYTEEEAVATVDTFGSLPPPHLCRVEEDGLHRQERRKGHHRH